LAVGDDGHGRREITDLKFEISEKEISEGETLEGEITDLKLEILEGEI
jgi:hypothetical protein